MKPMNPILKTAIDVALIATPAFVVGFILAKHLASRPKPNRPRYPYNITTK